MRTFKQLKIQPGKAPTSGKDVVIISIPGADACVLMEDPEALSMLAKALDIAAKNLLIVQRKGAATIYIPSFKGRLN